MPNIKERKVPAAGQEAKSALGEFFRRALANPHFRPAEKAALGIAPVSAPEIKSERKNTL